MDEENGGMIVAARCAQDEFVVLLFTAIARFEAAEDARKAVSQLSGKQMPELANSKVFCQDFLSLTA